MKHLNQKLNFERDSQYLAKMALYEIYPSQKEMIRNIFGELTEIIKKPKEESSFDEYDDQSSEEPVIEEEKNLTQLEELI